MNSIENNLKNYPFISPGDAYKTLTQTQLRDFSIIKEAFEQGKNAYAAKNYVFAVDSYTKTIEILASNLSMALLHRAAAFEMQHRYDLAFNDGQRAINNINRNTLNNNSDAHYGSIRDTHVSTSNSLIHQNKLNGAVSQYQQGLKVIPTTSPYHLELVQRHRQVATIIENRNKWLACYLPREVVIRIVSLLSLSDRGQLALTCRFWYDFVLGQSPDMWCIIDVMDRKFPTKLTSIQKLLSSVVPDRVGKVKLYLGNWEDAQRVTQEDDSNCNTDQAFPVTLTDDNISMLVNNDDDINADAGKRCDRKRRSHLVYSAIFEKNWNSIPEIEIVNPNQYQLRSLLGFNSKSVKHLKLIHNGDNDYYEESLFDAVEKCSNLISVTNLMGELTPSTLRLLPALPTSNLCLTTLELLCDMTTQSFGQLLRNTSSLTNLVLDARKMRHYAETLNLINAYCPVLQMFSYKHQNLPHYSHLTTYSSPLPLPTTSSSTSVSSIGLQKLDFSILYHGTETDHEANDQALDRLLKKSQGTLNYLKLGLREASLAKCRSLTSITQFGMPQLRQLFISIPDIQVQQFGSRQLASLISVCPMLETVNIWQGCAIWHDRILYALSKLPRLDQLIITAENLQLICYEQDDQYLLEEGLESAISNYGMKALFSGARSMTKFSFYAGDIGEDDSFVKQLASMISACSNIEELNIGFGEITNNQLIKVLERLEGSSMRVLKTDVPGKINDNVIKALATLSSSVEQLFIQDPFGDIRKSQLVQLLDQAIYPLEVKIKIRQNSYLKGFKPDPNTVMMMSDGQRQQKMVSTTDDESSSYTKYAIQQYYDEHELHDLRCGSCGQISAMNNE